VVAASVSELQAEAKSGSVRLTTCFVFTDKASQYPKVVSNPGAIGTLKCKDVLLKILFFPVS